MLTQKEMTNAPASRASILMKTGACVGGTIIGYLSQFVGRRRAIICAAFMSGCIIPAWILPVGERSLSVTGFFIQFFIQGAWGVIPIHLNELSPPAFRSTFPGMSSSMKPKSDCLTKTRALIPNRKHDILSICPDCQCDCRSYQSYCSFWKPGSSLWPHDGRRHSHHCPWYHGDNGVWTREAGSSFRVCCHWN